MAQNPFLYGPQPDEELDEAYRFARLSPDEQIAMRARLAQRGMEQGAEQLIRGAAGLPDSPTVNREKAGSELRALAQKVTPGTAEFYTQAADIFRKYGMVAEAETMTQRLNELEFGKGELNPVMKAQRVKDQLVKRLQAGDESVKPAIAALDRWLSTHGQDNNKAADPEFVRLMNAWEAEKDPTKKDLLKRALDAWLKNKERSGGDMTPYQQWRKEFETNNANAKTKAARDLAVTALKATVRALDIDIRNAQALLAHPGLGMVTGPRAGVLGRVGAALSGDAAGARALFLNVQAQTFIRALQDLKGASKATGLGQLTEKEGDKVQNAKVALDPQQPTDQFKETLLQYIGELQSTRAVAASELEEEDVPVPPAPAVALDRRPPVSAVAPDATPRPAAPKPAATAPKRKFRATKVSQ